MSKQKGMEERIKEVVAEETTPAKMELDSLAGNLGNFRTFSRVLRAYKSKLTEEIETEEAKRKAAKATKTPKETTEKPVGRSRYEVTQQEAAKQLGVSLRTVKNWESGKANPWGYTREKRHSKAEFGVFVATLRRDRATAENMMEGAGTLRLGNRKGMSVKKGMK